MELIFPTVAVKNLDEAVKTCVDVLGLKAPTRGPYCKNYAIDDPGFKIRFGFLEAGSCLLELVQPIEGPRVRMLEEKGEGTIYMLTFRVNDIEKLYDQLRSKGVTPVDWKDRPLKDKKYIATIAGNKIFCLPRDKTRGINIQIMEPSKDLASYLDTLH